MASESSFDEKETALLDLPPDVLTQIIGERIITLEDRMKLRATCKEMEELVALSDLNNSCFLEIVQKNSKSRDDNSMSRCATTICGLFSKKTRIPRGRHVAFTHLISRLFKRAHFGYIRILDFNFKPDCTGYDMGTDQLMKIVSIFACERLFIFVAAETSDRRMYELMDRMHISETLSLSLNDVHIEREDILRLPPLATLVISSISPICATSFDDSTFLSLVAKYRSLDLSVGPLRLSAVALIKAREIVRDQGHDLVVDTSFNVVSAMLGSLGIVRDGHVLMSSNPEDKVVSVRRTTPTNRSRWHHTIESGGTVICTFFDFTTERIFKHDQIVNLKIAMNE